LSARRLHLASAPVSLRSVHRCCRSTMEGPWSPTAEDEVVVAGPRWSPVRHRSLQRCPLRRAKRSVATPVSASALPRRHHIRVHHHLSVRDGAAAAEALPFPLVSCHCSQPKHRYRVTARDVRHERWPARASHQGTSRLWVVAALCKTVVQHCVDGPERIRPVGLVLFSQFSDLIQIIANFKKFYKF
jgi:hypothetical protein